MKKIISIMILALLLLGRNVYAENSEATIQQKAEVSYSVKKIKAANEINETSSFYDLGVTKGENKEIQAIIANSSNQPIYVKSQIFTAFTNENGTITYNTKPKSISKSLKFKLSDFATIEASDKRIEVPPHSEKTVTAFIDVPKDVPDGVMLGAWYFEKENQVVENKEEQGIGIANKYSYSLAIKVTVNQEIEKPELKLKGVTTGLSNYRKAIQATIENESPGIISKLTVNAQILNEKNGELLYERKQEDMIMAPNSNFSYPIFLKDQEMKPGDYVLNVEASTNDPKWPSQNWSWSQKFSITKEKAQQINQDALNDNVSSENNNNLVLIGVLFLIVSGLVTLFVLIRSNQKKKRKKLKMMAKRKKREETKLKQKRLSKRQDK
ncbi:DUF916 and DUF3324 domain-containing protein [Carnobacterium maltaromaticum]|uniref:DUF916 and DUF3324 domain-containing protein n=1 Tax=Carnobacterium maltaromaticum TaxID=2751 RepID=UPI001D96BBA4|nr:DUF916 and DUF3324 domain-containing protein [Carnobacterium maltaromaticum]MCC4311310.1 hypothetical protein [Carnobacterium maltaromaticum]